MRVILCFLLALVAAPAWAEWVAVTEAADGSVTVYVDPARIRKNGNFRKVWEIKDFKQRNEDGDMSWRVLYEYDCKEERSRILAFSMHSEPMAGGKVRVLNDDPGRWGAIPPESMGEAVLRFVCGK